MTVSTFYASSDGYIDASSTVYATALAGAGFTVDTADVLIAVGQLFDAGTTYYVDESFLAFDTSSIPDTDTISAVELALYGHTDNSTTDVTLECAAFDWSGGGLTSADWQDGTELDSLTVLATRATAGFSTAAYNVWTNSGDGSAMIAAISKTGTTYFVLFSAESRVNSAPTDSEYVKFWSTDEAEVGELRPRLTVTHAAADGGPAFIGGGFF